MTRQISRFEPTELVVGADSSITVTLLDSAGDALDITGASATWKLFRGVPRRRRKPFTGTALLEKTSAAGGIVLTAGQAVVSIADTDLARKSGAHWQVITVTDASGDVVCYGQGEVMLRAAA